MMMSAAPSSTLARRDRVALLVALCGLAALCWLLLIDMAGDMTGSMGVNPWSGSYFAMMLYMWIVMMIGMMAPTAVRSILIFTQISAKSVARGRPYIAGYWFAFGYVLVWAGYSAAATLLQWFLDHLTLLSPAMVASSPVLGALLLIGAGVWQFSSLKNTCLKHCRSPLLYLSANFRPGVGGAIHLGVRHGMYCLGCCWVLMGLLFVGGVMNLIWIALIAGFVLVEKLLPEGDRWRRMGGGAMILTGIGYLM